MRIRNIALIGMPGSFKTSIGRELAALIGVKAVDTDKLVETELNMSIPQIFEKYGLEYFRRAEEKSLINAVSMENVVISTGGGAVESQSNRNAMANCFVIYLSVSPNVLAKRINVANRPLLKGNVSQKINELYKGRKKLYEDCCDMVFCVNRISSRAAARKIYDVLIKKNIIQKKV